jgi:eukaryotic-like serine/threonine-protein kinase
LTTHYGRYQIKRELGSGTMGVVYLAHDPQIDREIALKVLQPDKVVSEEFVQRFLKEACAIGRLAHPNIVVVHDVGRDHGTIYIAMEYLEGDTFSELIRSGRPDYSTWARVGAELAETLAHAHEKGIIHRDIKPSNIIMTKDGRVKLTDFGIARIEDPAATLQTQVGAILGTPSYMSPEQVSGKTVDGRSDLFSLGVVLYEWLLGQRPFTGGNITAVFRAITDQKPPPPRDLDPALPSSLSELLLKMLQKPVDQRFCDGHEMATALRNSLKQTLPLGIPAKRNPPLPKKNHSKWLLGGIGFALLAMAVYYGGPKMVQHFRPWIDPPQSAVSAQQPPAETPHGATQIPESEAAPREVRLREANLLVSSAPPGAQIFINQNLKGTAPAQLTLPLGDYDVRLRLADHYEWEAQIQLSEPGQMPLHVKLVPKQ